MFESKIPKQPMMIIDTLAKNGYNAYIVGGCVRDLFLDRCPKDWDICTNATPEQVKVVFSGFRTIDTGLKHGTVTIIFDGESYEITTYRIDGNYSDGRRPDEVKFTGNLKKDLSRRDFTINSIAYNTEDGVVDYFDGLFDLEDSVIRCVGDPNQRFNEDALRVLRALRFAAVLGFDIEENTSKAIFESYKLLSKISAERIASELNRLICGDNASEILDKYSEVIGYIIPELKPTFGFEQHNLYHCYDVWKHTLKALSCSNNDLETRLAVLFHDIGKPKAYSCKDGVGHFYKHHVYSKEITKDVLKRMKYDNKTIDNVCLLVYNHSVPMTDKKKSVKKMLGAVGGLFDKLLDVKFSDMYGQSQMSIVKKEPILNNIREIYKQIVAENECFKLKDLAVNGKDLISAGFKEGKEIGTTLNKLLDMVIDGKIENDKKLLLLKAQDI